MAHERKEGEGQAPRRAKIPLSNIIARRNQLRDERQELSADQIVEMEYSGQILDALGILSVWLEDELRQLEGQPGTTPSDTTVARMEEIDKVQVLMSELGLSDPNLPL